MELPPLFLNDLRGQLIRQEETIIFALIERAQFGANAKVYEQGGGSIFSAGGDKASLISGSFLDFMMAETEKLHSMVRRYTVQDEHAFFPNSVAPPVLPALNVDPKIMPNPININDKIKRVYEGQILSRMCSGDDGNYGSAAVCDIAVLQALSKRIHFGKFIAEAKFQSERERYSALIRAGDSAGLMACLTKPTVEVAVLERVRLKASTYGQDPQRKSTDGADDIVYKVDPELIKDLYGTWVMPLTKEVQIHYLLRRLGAPLVSYVGKPLSGTAVSSSAGVGAGADSGLTSARWYFEDKVNVGAENPDYRYTARPSATAVVDAVKGNTAGTGIFRFETSNLGIDPVAQQALFDSGLYITKEKWREVKCEAFVNPKLTHWPPISSGAGKSENWRVYGTRGSLARCSTWIDVTLSTSAERVEVDTTEEAIARLHEQQGETGASTRTVAVIVPSCIPGVVGLQEVSGGGAAGTARDRYVQVGKQLIGPSGDDETILTFSVDGSSPGELSQALVVFQKHAVNLRQIQSLVVGTGKLGFCFYVVIDGHVEDAHVAAAIAEVNGHLPAPATILGSFMRDTTIHDASTLQAYTTMPPPTTPTPATTALAAAAAASSPPVSVAIGKGEKVASVGFLGPAATYTHQATMKMFGGDPKAPTTAGERLSAHPTIKSVFDAVADGSVAAGIVPVENSAQGGVVDTLDLLGRSDVSIAAQVSLPIQHCLLSNEKDLSTITEVISKAQALAQCGVWLKANLPSAKLTNCSSTAQAVEMVAAGDRPGAAAIASCLAAEVHSLPALHVGVQDKKDNVTRFLAIVKAGAAATATAVANAASASASASASDGSSRVSLLLNPSGGVVGFLDLLQKVEELCSGGSIVWLESRASVGTAWQSRYFVDFVVQPTADDASAAAVANRIEAAVASIDQVTFLGSA